MYKKTWIIVEFYALSNDIITFYFKIFNLSLKIVKQYVFLLTCKKNDPNILN